MKSAFRSLLRANLAGFPCSSQTAKTPDVILILADDLGWNHVGLNGCREIPAPHPDELATHEVRCTAGYITAPPCSPSRAGLMTGRYQQRFGLESIPDAPLAESNDDSLFFDDDDRCATAEGSGR